jgi:hypothetical protein
MKRVFSIIIFLCLLAGNLTAKDSTFFFHFRMQHEQSYFYNTTIASDLGTRSVAFGISINDRGRSIIWDFEFFPTYLSAYRYKSKVYSNQKRVPGTTIRARQFTPLSLTYFEPVINVSFNVGFRVFLKPRIFKGRLFHGYSGGLFVARNKDQIYGSDIGNRFLGFYRLNKVNPYGGIQSDPRGHGTPVVVLVSLKGGWMRSVNHRIKYGFHFQYDVGIGNIFIRKISIGLTSMF